MIVVGVVITLLGFVVSVSSLGLAEEYRSANGDGPGWHRRSASWE